MKEDAFVSCAFVELTNRLASIQVRRGTVPDPSTGGRETGTEHLRASCPRQDLYKSFSIILKDRT